MMLGGLAGLFCGVLGSIIFALIAAVALGQQGAMDIALAIAPFGGMLGMGIGATWLLLRSDKKR